MRRITAEGPGVVGGYLQGAAEGRVAVGSAAWQDWLATPGPDHHSFTFAAVPQGLHRALREWRPAGPGRSDERPYWYVKVRVGARIQRFYLGPPTAIDTARLAAVATAIAAARATAAAPGKEADPQPNR
jgi:hypothetical protein